MVFLGGAVLANIVCVDGQIVACNIFVHLANLWQMADKDDMWISRQEWQEEGPRVLEKLGKR